MTRLRNLIERIEQGTGASLGFGGTQSGRLPAMALIARCSGDVEAAVAAAAAAAGESADAVVLAVGDAPADKLPDLGGRIWGAGGVGLTPDNVRLWEAAGADFMVSPPMGAIVDAVRIAAPGLTHGLRIPDEPDDGIWRALNAAPVDILVLDKSGMAGPWTFADLGQVADAVSRTDKFQFVRVGLRPTANELAALHQAGVVGIVAEANQLGAEGLAGLKADLMALPRVQPAGRRRRQPTLDSPSA